MKTSKSHKRKFFNSSKPSPLDRIRSLKPAPVEPEPVAYVLPYWFQDEAAKSAETAKALGLTAEFWEWADMIGRCYMPDHPDYPKEGAVGVRVCRRWLRFENFMADMGLVPESESSAGTVH